MPESPASPESPTLSPAACAAVADGAQADSITALCDFVSRYRRLFVLTGAGVSTASGIPGYRDTNGDWMRAQPIQLQAFLGSEAARRRYWARSMVGWPVLSNAEPNAAHQALAALEATGCIARLVTQNVDGLHQRAGSADVIELHGSIDRVGCLACGAEHARTTIQHMLARDNPALVDAVAAPSADGDAHLEWHALDAFRVPTCPHCGGMLKPSVVFFGENVPRVRVEAATEALEAADAMLVVGSSLMVYSGYRFCVWAERAGLPIACVNLGRTRADALLALKVQAPCGEALTALAAHVATPFSYR
ncbi:NAD-dependent protein deacetylase [Trinickia fusca]|uniref:NAD-dependent protein deacetylase n=1 Tax=Trinickia fusca TaxID=2419777 RepID=A0A494XD77_9BURK|nr:NAD-dependent protein deacetylase [Trinickia fusca]RKP47611.1 NAD-dependent protein deacetylase [Trinickia fusca]